MPTPDTSEYDVVVVGGGPGGSTAAFQLSQFGYDVVLIDHETFPRDKLCGGLITYKTIRLLERVFDTSFDELMEGGILDFEADEYAAYFNDDLVKQDDIDVPFHFAKRYDYDEFLFDQAVESGVATHLGDGVSEVNTDDGLVITTSGETFNGEYIIGADGASSRVRNDLAAAGKVDTSGWNRNLAIGAEAYIPRAEVDFDVDYPLIHFGVLNWGYGWVFPNSDRLLVGVGGLNRKNETGFRDLLDRYLELLGIDHEPETVKGHPIPFGNFLDYPAHERTLLVGDAAGTVDGITGEGIFYAQRSGELAAWAITQTESRPDSPADQYVSLLEDHVHPELRNSKRTRRFIWSGPQKPRHLAMRVWVALFSDPSIELVHGIRIYDFLRQEGERMHESLPTSPKSE